jgi:hypothetical protein
MAAKQLTEGARISGDMVAQQLIISARILVRSVGHGAHELTRVLINLRS